MGSFRGVELSDVVVSSRRLTLRPWQAEDVGRSWRSCGRADAPIPGPARPVHRGRCAGVRDRGRRGRARRRDRARLRRRGTGRPAAWWVRPLRCRSAPGTPTSATGSRRGPAPRIRGRGDRRARPVGLRARRAPHRVAPGRGQRGVGPGRPAGRVRFRRRAPRIPADPDRTGRPGRVRPTANDSGAPLSPGFPLCPRAGAATATSLIVPWCSTTWSRSSRPSTTR